MKASHFQYCILIAETVIVYVTYLEYELYVGLLCRLFSGKGRTYFCTNCNETKQIPLFKAPTRHITNHIRKFSHIGLS